VCLAGGGLAEIKQVKEIGEVEVQNSIGVMAAGHKRRRWKEKSRQKLLIKDDLAATGVERKSATPKLKRQIQ